MDAGLERKVSEKKSVQLVRDLQAQLSKLQAVASSPKPSRLGSRSPRASTATNDADGPVPVDLKVQHVFCLLSLRRGLLSSLFPFSSAR